MKKWKSDDPNQQQIDFVRGRRRTCIERMVIPRFERADSKGNRRLVRTAKMKHLMRVVESYARDGGPCSLHVATIGRDMGVSEDTVSRAIADCEQIGLLTVERSFDARRASTFTIVWCEVIQLILNDPSTASLIEQPTKKMTCEKTADPPQLAADPPQLAADPPQLAADPPQLAADPPQLAVVAGGALYSSRARILKPSSTTCETSNQTTCSSSRENKGEEVLEVEDGETQNENQDDSDWDEECSRGEYCGWPFKIKPKHLDRWTFVMRFWTHANLRGWVYPSERLKFFRLSVYALRGWREGTIKNLGAWFTSRVRECHRTGAWPGNADDERIAADAIRALTMPKPKSLADERAALEAEVRRRIAREASRP